MDRCRIVDLPVAVLDRSNSCMWQRAASTIEDGRPGRVSQGAAAQDLTTSGAISLAADDTGDTTALHVTPRAVPTGITEILLTVELARMNNTSSPPQLQVVDLDTGSAIGHVALPTPGATDLLQLGALQRIADGWALHPLPAQLDLDLASLATATGVDVA
jgi:hypothetical protein